MQYAFFSISFHAPSTAATPIELVFIMGVSELIDSINLATRKSSELKDEDREKLLNACGKLQSSLEGPRDKLMKMIFSVSIHRVHISKWFLTKLQSLQPVALGLAVDMQIFDTAAALSAARKEIRAEDLALPKGADTLLVGESQFQDVKDCKELTIY